MAHHIQKNDQRNKKQMVEQGKRTLSITKERSKRGQDM
jgi:hypothetical protein